ncbi:MAG: hypothetical protein JO353_04155 [Phycisphaerae bacterium]|nr:hypothetical protein [Phycisphaerae bacterium]
MNRRLQHRGFTFVELCLGLVITSMVLAGVASFAMAVSTAWRNAGSSESILLSANHDALLLNEKIRACGLTGGWTSGSIDGSSTTGAAVLLWKGDANSDGFINYTEILLIQHDPKTSRINLYQTPTGYSGLNLVYSYLAVFSQSSFISLFKTGLTPTVLCSNVSGAQFYVGSPSSATARPFVEFALTVKAGSTSQIVYGDATLRNPLPTPSN